MPHSFQSRIFRSILRRVMKRKAMNVEEIRSGAGMIAMPASLLPRGVTFVRDMIGHVPVEWVNPTDGEPAGTIVHLHGGGYVSGNPDTHRMLTSLLATTSGSTVVVPDYRLAPEHPFPAALEDALAVYRHLLSTGHRPDRIAFSGDSAGGGLALAVVGRLKELDEALPAAVVCMSPWTDLALRNPSHSTNAETDVVLNASSLREWAGMYANGASLDDPRLSPLNGDFAGFPPLMIYVSGDEMLLDDAVMVARKAEKAGVRVDLRIQDGLWHCWQLLGTLLPENKMAFKETSRFLRERFGIPRT